MKKIIVLTLMFGFTTPSFCQETSSKKQLFTGEDYLKKSQRQKKTGFILLGGGAASIIISAVIPRGESIGKINWYTWSEEHKNDGLKAAFGLAGLASVLSSVPFFIASGKNKRKANAVSASFKNENASIVHGGNFSKINYPAISLKMKLN